MQQNIFINNTELIRANLIFDKYYDFKLSKGPAYDYMASFKDIASFDFSKIESLKTIFSDIKWPGAINDGITLSHIGLTGYDNGLLEFEDSGYSNEDIYNAFENDKLELTKGSNYDRFFMTSVFDNTFRKDKQIELIDNYLSFKGGFYQGFFKIQNQCYQTLPIKIENEINVSLSIRPRENDDWAFQQNIFYIGSRAENKFAAFYNNDYTIPENQYFIELINDDYLAENEYEKVVIDKDMSEIELEDGISLTDDTKESVITDNKFIFFNETKDGFNAETWKEGDVVSLVTDKPKPSVNLFPIMHYGKDGKTVDDIEEIENSSKEKYDINGDISENALSIFITKNGEIGYKYLVKTCENDDRIEVKEEKSKEGLIKNNEWNEISIIFSHLRDGYMSISIYVNGFLILVSVNLPELNLRGLKDSDKKQEAVPFNISLGGGTDGLKNAIYPLEYEFNNMNYLLQKNFSDSFYGDIRSFDIKEKTE